MAFNVEIRGLRELQAKISSMPKEIHKEVSAAVESGAKKWVRDAKDAAPLNYGKLKQGISYKRVSGKDISFQIFSNSSYSPYMEWGTKSKAVIPSDEVQYASEFQGKGIGSLDEFFMSILNWVKKKGLADTYSTGIAGKNKITAKSSQRKGKRRRASDAQAFDLAYVIMLSILKKGVSPHPFFFKQKEPVLQFVEQKLLNIAKSIK